MDPIAVSILTGFLGAGKTTVLNRLLKDPSLKNTAVIINEFGEVAIDHLLVEQSSDGVIELADGCLCCTVRGELVDTLADLIERVQTGRSAPIERIVIETTGLADPVPVLQSVMGHPALMHALRLDGVITLVDAVNGLSTLDAHEEARRQVAVADRILISKSDLSVASERLVARLRDLNPGGQIVTGSADAGASVLSCGLFDPATKTADVNRWLGERDADDEHHHSHDHAHEHHHGHHDEKIRTYSLVHPDPVPWSTIEMFLDLLRSTQGERLLRMKGIIEIAEDPDRPLVVHGVQKLMHPPARLPAWPDATRGTRLVLITHDLPEDYVQRLFGAFVGRPATDMPDRTAMTDNPLAIAGYKA